MLITYRDKYNSQRTEKYEGGQGTFSRSTYGFNQAKFVSVEPCEVNTGCFELNATVTGFKILDIGIGSRRARPSDLSMGATTTFINDGWATVSQEYTATKTIVEATETSLIRTFSKMNNWNVQAGVEVEFEGGVPFIASNKVKASLQTSYTREHTDTSESGTTQRHETSTEFSVNQHIEIEPCTRYKVDAVVKMKTAYPIRYNMTYEIMGTIGSRLLTATEIKSRMGGLSYLRDKNSNTVVAWEVANIHLDFGVESVIEGQGEVIQECINNAQKVSTYQLKANRNMTRG